jgi:peptidoglycan-associated lipoprotein
MKRASLLVVSFALFACAHAKVEKEFEADESYPVFKKPSAEEAAAAKARAHLAEVAGDASVYFDYDQSGLTDAELEKLRALAGALKEVPAAQVVIHGNCDERGTEEYNLVLGQKRADNAKNYMVGLGVETQRLAAVSMGEARALHVTAEEASPDQLWAQDRRDDFFVFEPNRDLALTPVPVPAVARK